MWALQDVPLSPFGRAPAIIFIVLGDATGPSYGFSGAGRELNFIERAPDSTGHAAVTDA